MGKKTITEQEKIESLSIPNKQLTQDNKQNIDEIIMNRFIDLTFIAGHNALNSIKDNLKDYNEINEDENISSVDKAIGKRKIMIMDIGLGTVTIGSVLTLVWLAKKICII